MSASLVRKSLMIVDDEIFNKKQKIRRLKGTEVNKLKPDNHKLIAKTYKKGKGCKVDLLPSERKQTVADIRKKFKSKEEILKENLKKLELIKATSKVTLDEDTVNQIIERAVTKRPVKKGGKKSKKNQKTVFTEQDFKKFEDEYFDE